MVANLLTGLGIDEYLTRTDAGGARHLVTDVLGSTVAELDGSATAQAMLAYEPFGATAVTGTSANAFRYTGREDDGIGLYYYRARYYYPDLHRFISEDPIGVAGGDVNVHAYVHNNPLNFVDPFGLCGLAKVPNWARWYVKGIEKPLGRLAVIHAFVGIGATVAATGPALVAAAGPAGIFPGTAVAGGGLYLIAMGTDMYINGINGLFGIRIPGPHDVAPQAFPRVDPVFGGRC